MTITYVTEDASIPPPSVDLFRTVLGGTPKSTFARWLAADLIRPEETMADVTRSGT
jgi:hypothetical protein